MRDGSPRGMETDRRARAPSLTDGAEERINTMSESLIDLMLYDEELSDELPDAALEVAASKSWEQVGNPYTLAFCSGLDSCPRLAE